MRILDKIFGKKRKTNSSNDNCKKCPKCGREVNATAFNCGFCGYSFSSQTMPKTSTNNSKTQSIKSVNKPAVNNSDSDISEEDIKRINDENVLIGIAKNDCNSYYIRGKAGEKAVKMIDDEYILSDLIKSIDSANITFFGKDAIKKINDEHILADIAKDENIDWTLSKEATKKINNESILFDIVKMDSTKFGQDYVRREAVRKINDKTLLEDIANSSTDDKVRLEARTKISNGSGDETLLMDIVKNSSDQSARSDAIKKINNQEFLKSIARNKSDDKYVRSAAFNNITDQIFISEFVDDKEIEIRKAVARNTDDAFILLQMTSGGYPQLSSIAKDRLKEMSKDEIILEHDISLKKVIDITVDNLVINGNGKTIYGNGKFIKITSKNVVLKNITFKDFATLKTGGVMVISDASVTLENCNFESNKSGFGGAIHIKDSSVSILNSNFKNNKATNEGGGAIGFNRGNLNIKDCIFDNNTSQNFSGALRLYNGPVAIENSIFKNNIANMHAGAISINNCDVNLKKCIFKANKGHAGGAINTPESNNNLELDSCIFEDNIGKNGGAINNGGTLKLKDCEFKTDNDDIVGEYTKL